MSESKKEVEQAVIVLTKTGKTIEVNVHGYGEIYGFAEEMGRFICEVMKNPPADFRENA